MDTKRDSACCTADGLLPNLLLNILAVTVGCPMRYIAVCTDRPLYLCSSNRLRYLCRTLTRRFTLSSASSQDSSMSWQKNSIQSSQSPFVETPSNLS